jgi:hypothetical protein
MAEVSTSLTFVCRTRFDLHTWWHSSKARYLHAGDENDRLLPFHDVQTFLSHLSQLASSRFEPSTVKQMTHQATFYCRHCTDDGRPLACFVRTTNVKTLQSTVQLCCYCEHHSWMVDVVHDSRLLLSDGTQDSGPLAHDHPLRTWAKLLIKTGHDLQVVHGTASQCPVRIDLAVHHLQIMARCDK